MEQFMPGKQAKILSEDDLQDLLAYASATRNPIRNAVIVLLSAKAGLRAGEIANLTWDMVVDASGQISGLIELTDNAAKKCSGRSIPVHPDLIAALATWRRVAPPSAYVQGICQSTWQYRWGAPRLGRFARGHWPSRFRKSPPGHRQSLAPPKGHTSRPVAYTF